ncbi:MAG: MBL fold metallo-hydrolase [Fimbriiglobus sp.]
MKPHMDHSGEHPATDDPTLTFWGAASSVSGSMHILEVGSRKLLFDCGLNQGRRDETRERNTSFPFHPQQIDAVIVSHAHIDHCGNVPTLVKQGFRGPIYCTPATRDLLRVMLRDSAKVQEEEAGHANIARNFAEPLVQPLYHHGDVEKALKQAINVPYGEEIDVGPKIRFRFAEAGHILGSAMVHAEADGPNGTRTVTFTGDLGRRGMPLLKPTAEVPPADLLICESTYGNRKHEPLDGTIAKLYDAVNRTVARGGKALIPAFSLGRIQLIIHFLQLGLRKGAVESVPIFVDSPLAADVAEVYRNHPNALEPSVAAAVREGHGILGGDGVRYIRDMDESTRVMTRPGPAVVIASSGMCDAGRIQFHLKQHIDDPRCSVILVSFQAPGTTGRRLLEPKPTIRMLGKDWNKWIEVTHLEGFSGHADQSDFLAYLGPIAGKVGKVRLIHGEREQSLNLAELLRDNGFDDVSVPEPGDRVTL